MSNHPFRNRMKMFFLNRLACRPHLASFYHLVKGTFDREHMAVLYGKLRQLDIRLDSPRDEHVFALRRCIHRLEKALTMTPRRPVFALDYIENTVDLYTLFATQISARREGDMLLVAWAGDVLHSCFQAMNSHPNIDRARVKFEETAKRIGYVPGSRRPYKRDLSPLRATYDDLLELAKRRRSVRSYLPKPVPRKLIDKAIEVALYSPSACNRQSFEMRIYDDRELIMKIGKIPMGAREFYERFPCLIVLLGLMRAFTGEQDRHLVYIDASLAAMAFQFALEVQGISSCCINWPDVPEREEMLAKVLNLELDERPIMLMSAGYADPEGLVPYSQKSSLNDIRSYNKS